MTLEAGTRIGRYEIIAPIGAGGMGEVYRALDASLGRMAALKILPAEFSTDPDRVVRFEREARTLAALNHPNIAQIYGSERSDGLQALAMELVEGEDLSQRIDRGPLPVEDALLIAKQIAEALEVAHEQGIIHRDLKPANVKITHDGNVKVLDFGLAKAFDPAGALSGAGDAAVMNSPTMSIAGTRAGLILGTAAYMAPEQARGQVVDRRVDVWAFGVVLFEMLAGRRAFTGDTISDVLASVLKNDLDWSRLPPDVPAPVLALLRRCLTPDRKNRLRDIGEARFAIGEFVAHPPSAQAVHASATVPRAVASSRWWYAATAILALALAAALFQVWRSRQAPAPVVRYMVEPPGKAIIDVTSRPTVTLSPDGRLLVFAAFENDTSRLYWQGREDFRPRVLSGTEGASDPVISPDGRAVVFAAGGRLILLPFDGAAVHLAPVNDPRGASWADASTIVYTPQATGGVFEISTAGGAPRPLTTVKEAVGERSHRWPNVLPGGRYVLFTVGTVGSPDNYDDAEVAVVDRQTGERRTVLKGATMARYASTGHLLYVRRGVLFAIRFDLDRLSTQGAAVPVLQGVGADVTTGAAHVAWAADGTLAYVSNDVTGGLRTIVWSDRKGQIAPVDLPGNPGGGIYNDMRISPDGSRVALVVATSGSGDIWVFHFGRRTFTRLTFSGTNATPVWSADGRVIYYSSVLPSGRRTTIMRIDADGGVDGTAVTAFDVRAHLKFVSADGTWGVVDQVAFAGNKSDIAKFTMAEKPVVTRLAATTSDEYGSRVSPDGRWLAYQSDENDGFEIYVRALSGPSGRWQVSNAGGEEPIWSPDGRQLYYRYSNRLMMVSIEGQPSFRSGVPALLFDGIYDLRSDTNMSFDVPPDGGRFLMLRPAARGESTGIRVVRNWFDELRRLTDKR